MNVDSTGSEQADELLVVRCQLGERAAFDELIRRWLGPLRRYLLRVTGDADSADELAQDIWLRVLHGFGRLRESAKFRSWLFGIAHRTLIDRLRLRYANQIDANTEFAEIAGADIGSDRTDALRELERGLKLLPVAEREVLTLFYLEELALSEVGVVLAVPIGTVKSRLFRARNLLRQLLIGKERHHE